MKRWNSPDFVSLNITETAAPGHQNGNTHGKPCKYDPTLECNSQGGGKGVCKNCPYDIGGSGSTGSSSDSSDDTEMLS